MSIGSVNTFGPLLPFDVGVVVVALVASMIGRGDGPTFVVVGDGDIVNDGGGKAVLGDDVSNTSVDVAAVVVGDVIAVERRVVAVVAVVVVGVVVVTAARAVNEMVFDDKPMP